MAIKSSKTLDNSTSFMPEVMHKKVGLEDFIMLATVGKVRKYLKRALLEKYIKWRRRIIIKFMQSNA